MLIDLTYSCHMGCTHCLSDCKPDNNHMSLQTLDDTFAFMRKHKIETYIFTGGEPFEHPDILTILDKIEQEWTKKFPLTFISNGRPLLQNKELYKKMQSLIDRYGSHNVQLQITNDPRFYPVPLTEKEKRQLRRLTSIIDTVPVINGKCLYPQGRALQNFPDSNWLTVAPKCCNIRLFVKQGFVSIHTIVVKLAQFGKFCTPVIAPNGDIKIGESALCPAIATIYDTNNTIIKNIKNCKCQQCTIAWEKLKATNSVAYYLLTH